MSSLQIGLAIFLPAATQLIFIGFLYGRLQGRLQLIEYRLRQVEVALTHRGVHVRSDNRGLSD